MHRDTPLLEVRGLVKHFRVPPGSLIPRWHDANRALRAVDGVSFDLAPGETLGLVGESGCGKTTLAYAILGLTQATAGQIFFEGDDVTHPSRDALRRMRRKMQIIFQDPFSSLNPRQTVEEILREPLEIHGIGGRRHRRQRVLELMDLVALPRRLARAYPYALSGGLRQRVGIAAALALNPTLVFADEPTSALDASVQAEIVNLLSDLQRDTGVAYVLISHNLDIVRHMSHRVAVMYLGKIVEIGPVDSVYGAPRHPYTRALLASIPVPDPAARLESLRLPGEVPSPIDIPSGCPFHTRCWLAQDICRAVAPDLLEFGPRHLASCHVAADELRAGRLSSAGRS